MRKPDFCICENKAADQLYDNNAAADLHLCLRYIDCKIPLLSKSKISSLLSHTVQFVSDLVGNPADRFTYDTAHMLARTRNKPQGNKLTNNLAFVPHAVIPCSSCCDKTLLPGFQLGRTQNQPLSSAKETQI